LEVEDDNGAQNQKRAILDKEAELSKVLLLLVGTLFLWLEAVQASEFWEWYWLRNAIEEQSAQRVADNPSAKLSNVRHLQAHR
jgi:hypothetical protein